MAKYFSESVFRWMSLLSLRCPLLGQKLIPYSTLFQLQTDETIDGQMLLKEFERRDSTTPENFHIQMDCATENICSICIR